MNDEQALRRLAREAITAAKVPAGRPRETWGGDGTGAICDICGLSIARHEIGFEVEFSGDTAPARTCHLHDQCFAAWELERHALEAHPAPATDRHPLSGGDKAGSMPDGERNVKDGGESP